MKVAHVQKHEDERSCKVAWFVGSLLRDFGGSLSSESLGLFAGLFLRRWFVQQRNLPNHIPVDPKPV